MREWDSTICVSPDIGISTSRDILEAINSGDGPNDSLVALGYAGWGAGQLEQEMAQNAWLSGPVDSDIIFSTPPADRSTGFQRSGAPESGARRGGSAHGRGACR